MREIDDRYPEFARPYEPVKGGKHHKRLGNSVLPVVAALLVGLCALVPGKTVPPGPPKPPVVVTPTPTPTPEPEPEISPPPTEPPVTPGPTDPPVTPGPTPYRPVNPPVTARPTYMAAAFTSAVTEHIEEPPSLDDFDEEWEIAKEAIDDAA